MHDVAACVDDEVADRDRRRGAFVVPSQQCAQARQ